MSDPPNLSDVPADPNAAAEYNRNLVQTLTEHGIIRSDAVAQAFIRTPRHRFLPGLPLDRAYANQAVPTKLVDEQAVSSASQPAMIAIMLEQLALEPGHNVLEIGAGTGYNAALMSRLVGPSGHVITIDIDEDLVEGAQAHLAALGIRNVHVLCADGGYGFADRAPYDRIILTVGSADITPHWWAQLADDGRMVLPLEFGPGQKSIALDRVGDHLQSASIRDCAFIRLRGEYSGSGITAIPLGAEPGLDAMVPNALVQHLNAAALYSWLNERGTTWSTDVSIYPEEIREGLGLWLTLQEPELSYLVAQGEIAERPLVPPLLVRGDEHKMVSTCMLFSAHGMAALFLLPARRGPSQLRVLQLGPDRAPARRLLGAVQGWNERGRPMLDAMRVRAYPKNAPHIPTGVFTIEKEWTSLVIDWPTHPNL